MSWLVNVIDVMEAFETVLPLTRKVTVSNKFVICASERRGFGQTFVGTNSPPPVLLVLGLEINAHAGAG